MIMTVVYHVDAQLLRRPEGAAGAGGAAAPNINLKNVVELQHLVELEVVEVERNERAVEICITMVLQTA